MIAPTLRTERLLLRPWRSEDLDAFAALNADPEVMRCFPAPLTREESDDLVDRIEAHFAEHGFGFWAVEVLGGASFVGFTGLAVAPFEAPFTPAVEIGWRLAREHWGRGYATEAAHAALTFGFGELGLQEIVAFAVQDNSRSRAVMERLGMTHDPADDFNHPRLPSGHPLELHVLYRIRRAEYLTAARCLEVAWR